jgi:hypothetical protein
MSPPIRHGNLVRYGTSVVRDRTAIPVDPVPGGRRMGMFSRASGHDVTVRQRFSGLVRVDTITTSGDRRSPLEAAGDGRGGRTAPGPAAVQLVHRRFAECSMSGSGRAL